MILHVLSENTASSDAFECEHGLSLHLETAMGTILFDTGSSGLFARNAERLGLDLSQVVTAILSHGHYDHGGGLETFLDLNRTARLLLHERAFEPHRAMREGGRLSDIGLEPGLMRNQERFDFCSGVCQPMKGLTVFSDVRGLRLRPNGNQVLLMRNPQKEREAHSASEWVPDDFQHEQNLMLEENGHLILVAGCAHNGILNILDRFRDLAGRYPDLTISGFHLWNRSSGETESPETIHALADALKETGSMLLTGHCTGEEPFRRLQKRLGERLEAMSSGMRFEF